MREYLRTHKREILMAYAQIFIGSVIGAAAYPTFLIPNNIAPGGLTGVATILNYLAGWPVGIGGSDMIARMVHRRFSFITVGMFLFALDFLVVLAAAIFIGGTQALYAMIDIYVCSRVIDAVMVGFGGNKACFVMTDAWQKVTGRVLNEIERGCTLLEAKGAYSGTSRPVVMCVMSRQEMTALKRIVQEEDEKAFMFITDAHEALGEGFSRLDGKD